MKKVFLILCILVIAGLAQAQNETIIKGIELKETDEVSFLYNEYIGESEFSISTNGIKKINMETGAGRVEVRPSKGNQLSIHAEIVIASKNIKSAYEIVNEYLNLGVSRNNNELLIESLFDYNGNDEDGNESLGLLKAPERKINITISVPNNIDLRINDRAGELFIADVKNNIDVTDGLGNLRIKNVIGNLKLRDASGEVNVTGVNHGETKRYQIYIEDRSGGLTVKDIAGTTTIDDTSGGIQVDKVRGDLDIRDTSGGVDVNKVIGFLTINDTSGGIIATNIKGGVKVSDSSGGIYINEVTEDVVVKNDGSGGVTVHNVGGELRR